MGANARALPACGAAANRGGRGAGDSTHPPASTPLPRRRADSSGRVAAMSGVLDVLWEDRDVRFDISPQ